jgi:hypothetical protein
MIRKPVGMIRGTLAGVDRFRFRSARLGGEDWGHTFDPRYSACSRLHYRDAGASFLTCRELFCQSSHRRLSARDRARSPRDPRADLRQSELEVVHLRHQLVWREGIQC